jgi:hypothetical protein
MARLRCPQNQAVRCQIVKVHRLDDAFRCPVPSKVQTLLDRLTKREMRARLNFLRLA